MKKIQDYMNENNVGILCSTEEEWEAICKLTINGSRSKHTASGKFNDYRYPTIGIYQPGRGHGWGDKNLFRVVYPASDFLEPETPKELPIFN